jgi:predicted AlkP superfamily phosphohydrolase/phosphomutase
VAWSNFITGRNPGGHGIFDFIHRNPKTRTPAPSTVTEGESGHVNLPGEWQFPTGGGGDSNRTGRAFWTILGDAGVPADVWRMPINFPVESGDGVSFPGMMTPALDSAYGEFTLYTTDPPIDREISGGKIVEVQNRSGVIRTSILGPPNVFRKGDPTPVVRIPFEIYVDEDRNAAVLDTGSDILVLEPGEWSDFTTVSFDMLPGGFINLATSTRSSGILRFYLRSVAPEFELYASPINFDPKDPVEPVSEPAEASADLAGAIGDYYTQGMAEEVGGLKTKMLTDAEFMQQADLVYRERGEMLEYALDRYVASEDGGLLFFYYSTVDLCGHMMWRHEDDKHPFHDAALAAEDSSWWSGRPGSTWHDVIDDLYLKMDPVLGRIRERVGDDTAIMVMSDHGFAPFRRKFNLNTWLVEEGYLVLQDGREPEAPGGDPVYVWVDADWTKTRAYGIGFNGLYLNLAGREEGGIVQSGAEADALLAEIATKLEAIMDDDGTQVVLSADLARDVYEGERVSEAPDIIVGYNYAYGNSDEATQGRIPHAVLEDNLGGTFNGSHLMHPSVVNGVMIANGGWGTQVLSDPALEDLTVEILRQYDIQPDAEMDGRPVFD